MPVAVFDGSLRNLYDTSGLDVTLSLTADQISVVSDDGDLGTWPIDAVAICPYDTISYEFYAEGDLLLFTPNDPVGFRTSPFVVGLPPEPEHHKQRAPRRRSASPKAGRAIADARKKKARRADKKARESTEAASGKPPSPSAPSPSPAEEAPRAQISPPRDGDVPDTAAVVPPSDADEPALEAEVPPTPNGDTRDPGGSDSEEVKQAAAKPGMLTSVWLGVLDRVRRRDILDLNRVPVDRKLRGHEHTHTWDHRVATGEGLTNHLCTICGKVRISSRTG